MIIQFEQKFMESIELFLMYTYGFAECHMIGVTVCLYGFTEII